MKEIIEQLKQEEKKAEKRLANVKLLINLSESAKAIMESFAKINEINFNQNEKVFSKAPKIDLDEMMRKGSDEIIKNTFGQEYVVRDVSKIKEAVDKDFKEPLLNKRIVSATNEKECKFIFNGKAYKANLEKGDVIYVEENKVWLKRKVKYNEKTNSYESVNLLGFNQLFEFQGNDLFVKFELKAE